MEIEIDLEKTLHQNASDYYERSKKMKKKTIGARKALEKSKLELEKAKKIEVPTELEKKRTREWFEKYHWLKTKNGFLVIAGRDAKNNEHLVKKQMNQDDLFFHADIKGAPATILVDGQKAEKSDKEEAARLAAVFSKAWTVGVGAIDVYSVTPENVKTAAKSGEYLSKGSFVIEGKREWYKDVSLEIFAFMENGVPSLSITEGIRIVPGKTKKSDLAKKMKHTYGGTLDDWIQLLPQGGELR